MTTARAAALRGWLSGGSVYLGGVINRSALGVAALAAIHRFGISPAQLSVFVILQLGVYAAMQIPTGVLVDRFGSRRLLLTASALIGVAGLMFAYAPDYPTALLARGLLGCGDAMTYISVLRFAGSRFSSRRFPQVIALTSMFGFVATIIATVPLALLLHLAGWRVAFTVIALVPVIAGVAVAVTMPRGRPASRAVNGDRPTAAQTLSAVRRAWRTPGTRLGFWVHFSCMSTATVFALLWGLPFLVSIGFSTSAANEVLLMCVLVAVPVSLAVGLLVTARPILRVPFAFGSCAATLAAWVPLLLAGGDHPNRALVVVLVGLVAVGPPVSSIAFLLARDYNQPASGGTATGVVNCAGFIATILCAAAIGITLDLIGSSGPGAFRAALAAAFGIQAVGTVRIAVWWRRVRAGLLVDSERGRAVPIQVVRHPWDLLPAKAPGDVLDPASAGRTRVTADLAQ